MAVSGGRLISVILSSGRRNSLSVGVNGKVLYGEALNIVAYAADAYSYGLSAHDCAPHVGKHIIGQVAERVVNLAVRRQLGEENIVARYINRPRQS